MDIASLALKIDSTDAKQGADHLDRLAASGQKAATSADLMQAQFAKLMAILGPSALAAAFLINIKNAIALQEQYVRLSEVAGTTASMMSSMELPARLSGTSLDSVATSIARLSKAIGEARLDKSGESARLFKALGIDPEDGRDAAAVFVDVSKALVGMKDQNVAAAASLPLLSRGFAEMRPFMKEIVEQGELNARVTDEQAAASKRLLDDLVKIKFQFDENTFSLVEGLIPALQDITDAITETTVEGRELNEVGEVMGTMLKGVASLGFATADIFFGLGHQVAGLAAAVQAAARGEFQIAFDLINDVNAEVEKHTVETNERIRKIWEGTAKAARDAATGGGGAGPGGAGSASEANVKQLMEDKRLFAARIKELESSGIVYAQMVKTIQVLANEEFKQGGIDNLRTQIELMRRTEELERSSLENLARIQEEKVRLSVGPGGSPEKLAEAQGRLAEINAAIVANEVITQAQIQSLRTVTFQRQIEEYNAWAGQIEQLGEQVFTTEREREQRQYDARLEALDVFLKANQDLEEGGAAARARLAEQHAQNIVAISQEEWRSRTVIAELTNRDLLSINANFFGVLAGLVTSGSRRMFEIGKVASYANALIKTYEAANNAFAEGTKINIYAGYAFMAAAILAGMVNVQKIHSTTFGSTGAGGGSGGFTPSSGSQFPSSPPGGATSPAAPSGPQVTIIVVGSSNGMVSQQLIDQVIIPGLLDAQDRDVETMRVDSRDAQRIIEAARIKR